MRIRLLALALLVIGGGVLSGLHTVVRGQSLNRQLFGQDATWQASIEPTGQVADNLTLRFKRDGDPQLVTVTLSTTYLPQRPLPAPGVVDMVITEQPINESTPEISIQTGGRAALVATRLHSRRSISTSLSVDELGTLARAESIIAHPFSDELRFSPQQQETLKGAANVWSEQLQR